MRISRTNAIIILDSVQPKSNGMNREAARTQKTEPCRKDFSTPNVILKQPEMCGLLTNQQALKMLGGAGIHLSFKSLIRQVDQFLVHLRDRFCIIECFGNR